jgi:hypothetical protein
MKKYEEAISFLNSVFEDDPESDKFFMMRGTLYIEQQK